MPKYVIERELPGAGKLSPQELKAVSQKSCGVLRQMGPHVQWVTSYVTDDKIYCVYIAPDADAVRKHAEHLAVTARQEQESLDEIALGMHRRRSA